MSSKFKDLMAQARTRHEEAPDAAPQLIQEPTPVVPDADVATNKPPTEKSQTTIKTKPSDATRVDVEERDTVKQMEATTKKRGRPRGKRSHPDFEQVSAYISKDTYRNVKIALLQEGQNREFSELVEELLAQWLRTST